MSKLALAVAGRHTKEIQRMAILNRESGDGPWDLKTRPTDGPHSIRLCRTVITSKQNKYWVEMLTKIWTNKSHQTPCHAYNALRTCGWSESYALKLRQGSGYLHPSPRLPPLRFGWWKIPCRHRLGWWSSALTSVICCGLWHWLGGTMVAPW
jgi:hypothetical protein